MDAVALSCFTEVSPFIFSITLSPADGGENPDPVVIFKYPLFPFAVVVDHGYQASVRIDRQNPAQVPYGNAVGNLKMEFVFPETGEIGVIA
jgi:hypothetical protein